MAVYPKPKLIVNFSSSKMLLNVTPTLRKSPSDTKISKKKGLKWGQIENNELWRHFQKDSKD